MERLGEENSGRERERENRELYGAGKSQPDNVKEMGKGVIVDWSSRIDPRSTLWPTLKSLWGMPRPATISKLFIVDPQFPTNINCNNSDNNLDDHNNHDSHYDHDDHNNYDNHDNHDNHNNYDNHHNHADHDIHDYHDHHINHNNNKQFCASSFRAECLFSVQICVFNCKRAI